jgi:hypothetical protein
VSVSDSCKVLTQLAKILDDAVVDNGDRACAMRMGVGHGRGTMGGPAGVTYPCLAGEGLVDEEVGEVHELSHCPTAVKLAGVHRGDAGAVIAAILQPF